MPTTTALEKTMSHTGQPEQEGVPLVERKGGKQSELKSSFGSDVALRVKNSTLDDSFQLMKNHHADKYVLDFKDVKVSVHTPKWMPEFATPGVPGQSKEILHGISGSVSSGEVLAIIGASGSGKTTLLDQLAKVPLMQGGEASGSIKINGEEVTCDFFKTNCAYVYQDDRLWGALTVQENLEMASMLYVPDMTAVEREQQVNTVVNVLGLESCRHTKVGNVLIKGVSGGQRRRVSIGIELMGNAPILFLDEPTSGLDSKSAAEIMQYLTTLAKKLNVLIVCSIHQPSSRTFLAFDKTLVLSSGRVIYFGVAKDAVKYFSAKGYAPPPHMNPADHLIEISNPDFTDPKQVDALIESWENSESARLIKQKINKEIKHDTTPQSYSPHYAWEIMILSIRMFKSYMRDPGAYIGRSVLYATMATIFGIIYIDTERDQTHALDYLFAIAWGMATPSYMATMIMPVFSTESAIFEKEAKNGMYSPASYVIAAALVQIPFVLITSSLSVIPYYWITDLNPDPARFFIFYLLQFTFLYVIESLCVVFASFIPNFVIALGVVVSNLSVFFVFNGLFITPDAVPWVFRWLEFISPHNYATQGFSKLAFSGQDFSGFDTCTSACFGATGDDVLDAIQGLSSAVNVGAMFGILWGESAILRIIHWVILRNK